MANVRKKQIRRFFTTQEGKSMIPTKILLSYRFKTGSNTETPKVAVFAQVKNGGTEATQAPPVWINRDVEYVKATYDAKNLGDTLYDSGLLAANEDALETSQVVYLNEEYDITGLIIEIFGREHLSRLREVIFFYKVDEFSEEQEYQLV